MLPETPSSLLRLSRALALAGAWCVLSAPRTAAAVDACVPPPAGVVGRPGPPDWTLGGTPEVDDPRWHGATGEAFPDLTAGGSPDARSRLVQDGGSLFLQLRVMADATPGNVTGTTFRDSVYVAFADATLATVQVVRVAIDNAGGTHATRWSKAAGAWTSGPASAGAPAWLGGVTAWVNPSINGVATTQNWAVNLKIATASLPGTKLWYGTVISPTALTAVQPYAWPGRGGFVEPTPPDTGLVASTWGAQFDAIGAGNWGDYTTTTGVLPLPPGCQGIRIESNAIGTTNTPPWKINSNADNNFQATLSVTGGAAMPAAGSVKARFRIANWGMQIGVGGDWHDLTGGACVSGCTNTAAGVMQYSCPFVGPGSCPPHTSGPSDQCMLVELEPAVGSMTFSKDSAWRNMMFGPASEFIHDAEISLVGLPPEPTPRDVYIYVQAHNMPAKIDANRPPPDVVIAARARANAQDPKADRYARYRLEGLSSTELRILAGEPTYEVRGYRDTGLGPAGQQLLTPMVPYGYLMEHRGPLVGWKHDLVGVGTTVTTVIPGVLYKLSVLPGGKATVQTRIHALEKGATVPPVCGRCCCDLAQRNPGERSLGLALLTGAALLARRRRKSSGLANPADSQVQHE